MSSDEKENSSGIQKSIQKSIAVRDSSGIGKINQKSNALQGSYGKKRSDVVPHSSVILQSNCRSDAHSSVILKNNQRSISVQKSSSVQAMPKNSTVYRLTTKQ
ncbi:hypothetical protein CHS0354_016718 [Potamilus streckersoni]|uniref:Uncharacterized protein n=1 Tax=Potamilus streckersoni TaxID=2493646 RepID=A0AAE0WBV0_9BIVA|nr:hypothetical protein CHS0354_016718 [Potamilus streckersoni]